MRTWNDMPFKSGYTVTRGTAANTAVSTTSVRVFKVVLSPGTDALTLNLYNATATSGASSLTVTAAATGGSTVVDLSPHGYVFTTAMAANVSATTGAYQLFYVAE